MFTLRELVNAQLEITHALIESGGEITPDIQKFIDDVDIKLPAKLDSYSHVIDRLEMEIEFWKAKEEELYRFRSSLAKVQKALKDRIKDSLLTLDLTEIDGIETRFKLAKTSGSLELQEDLVPREYFIITMVPDKERIKNEIKSGQEIPGASIKPSWSLRKGFKK